MAKKPNTDKEQKIKKEKEREKKAKALRNNLLRRKKATLK